MTNSLRSRIINLISLGALVAVLLIGAMRYGQYNVSPEEIVRRYHILAYGNPAMWNLKWLGIPTYQNPNDVWIIQEIISEVKPDYIVETGTGRGGSTVIWSLIQHEVNSSGRVITIDIENAVDREKLPQTVRENVEFVIGNSVAPEIIEMVAQKVKGKSVLALLDSDHNRSHVLKELQSYSPLVCVESYIGVQDTNFNGHPVFSASYSGPGPMEAVEEFLTSNGEFQSDASREKMMFTMHPKGYLKRIRKSSF